MVHLTKIIAAVLVLLAIALGGYAWMLSRTPPPPVISASPTQSTAQSKVPTFAVVVAKQTLPAGQLISKDALRVEQLPINPAGAFINPDDLVNRVPVIDLGEGSPLLESQLSSGLALKVNEGERAVAIRADETMGVGNRVQPGDFVDVFFALKADGKDIDRSQVRLLLTRKRVLAYGNASVDGMPSKTADSKTGTNSPAPVQRSSEGARTAVLAVPVDEINRLTLGESSGRLLLALRNPTDTSLPDPKLFAELPTALQPLPPKAGEPRRPPLEGLDRAQAGLAVTDLVAGGGAQTSNTRRIASEVRPVTRTTTGTNPRSDSGLEVEVIRGDRRETVRY